MNGKIGVQSELGKGLAFGLISPLSDLPVMPELTESTEDLSISLLNKKIVVVDDDPSVLSALTALLESLRPRRYTFVDGQDAADEIVHIEPDFILLDLSCRLSGLETVTLIRKHLDSLPTSEVKPIVYAVTADIEHETDDLIVAGFDGRIGKAGYSKTLHDALGIPDYWVRDFPPDHCYEAVFLDAAKAL